MLSRYFLFFRFLIDMRIGLQGILLLWLVILIASILADELPDLDDDDLDLVWFP